MLKREQCLILRVRVDLRFAALDMSRLLPPVNALSSIHMIKLPRAISLRSIPDQFLAR